MRTDKRYEPEKRARIIGVCDLLHRAIENVVRNAVKFTRDGTSVEVHVHTTKEADVLTVSDQGPGITPENRTRDPGLTLLSLRRSDTKNFTFSCDTGLVVGGEVLATTR